MKRIGRELQPGDPVIVRYGWQGSQHGIVLGWTPSGKVVVRKVLANSGRMVTVRIQQTDILARGPK
jgi:hypothetical protein